MKKIIFLTFALVLAFVGTAWGQALVTDYSANYTINDLTFTGSEQTGVTFDSDNCDNGNGTISGNTGTNAGTYEAKITPNCGTGHTTSVGTGTVTWFHQNVISVTWTIKPAPMGTGVTVYANDGTTEIPADGTVIPSLKWDGNAQDPMGTTATTPLFKLKLGTYDLTATDFDYYITIPGTSVTTKTVTEEGRYTIVFVGVDNFTGVITRTFDVKKEMSESEATTGIHYAIPDQILTLNTTNSKYDLKEFTIEINDTKSHAILRETEDFTLTFFAGDAAVDDYLDSDPANDPTPITLADITAEGKYWVVIEGVAPKYTAKVKKEFYAIKEYQLTPGTLIDGGEAPQVSVRITKAGYPTYAPVGATAPVKGEVEVAMTPVINTDAATTFTPCIPIESNRCVILAGYNMKASLSTVFGSLTSEYTYDVVDIKNGVFAGCSKLRWIDVQIPAATWTPSSLDRDVINIDTPFCGVPKSAIVYLFGTTVTGENYVYKFGTDDYRCAQYRIYEDLSGEQTQYSK